MKQHITLEQLNELSEKGKEKLGQEFRHREGEIWNEDAICRWLSIGQMIELLGKNYPLALIDRKESGKTIRRLFVTYDKVCDALWQAVKEILEK